MGQNAQGGNGIGMTVDWNLEKDRDLFKRSQVFVRGCLGDAPEDIVNDVSLRVYHKMKRTLGLIETSTAREERRWGGR